MVVEATLAGDSVLAVVPTRLLYRKQYGTLYLWALGVLEPLKHGLVSLRQGLPGRMLCGFEAVQFPRRRFVAQLRKPQISNLGRDEPVRFCLSQASNTTKIRLERSQTGEC